MLPWLPVALVLLAPSLWLLDREGSAVRRVVTRVAVALFGDYVESDRVALERQQSLVRAAQIPTPYRIYAARTLLYSLLFGTTAGLAVVFVVVRVLAALGGVDPSLSPLLAVGPRPSELSSVELFLLIVGPGGLLGVGLAYAIHRLRWVLLGQRASSRASAIDATLPRTVAFVYALSRSGMPFPTVLETLSANRWVYGEAANEVTVAVRDMDEFGTDLLTALGRLARTTPSDEFADFAENLVSVLGSGRSLSSYLGSRYERLQDEAEARQEQYLELLATFAEVYVTVFVAGPLFLVTVLVVVGLVLSDTLPVLQVLAYVGLPLATAGFVVYVDSVTGTLDSPVEQREDGDRSGVGEVEAVGSRAGGPSGSEVGVADGGLPTADRWRVSRERLAVYDRLAPVRAVLDDPVGVLLRNPSSTFLLTVPFALLWLLARTDLVDQLRTATPSTAALVGPSLESDLAALDDALLQAALLVVGCYAIAYEFRKRRHRRIERAVPDFLDRMASVNEAGMSLGTGLRRVSQGELGALTPELEKAWRDVRWGADVESALRRLEDRTESAAVTRAVTLVANASRASGDIAPVLRIAADEAKAIRRLRRERRQEMFTYLLVIYISFLVFLGILVALELSFVPAIEAAQSAGAGGSTDGTPAGGSAVSGLESVDVGAYSLVFFHAAAIQAVCSGLVAGVLAEQEVADGAKHVTAMLGLAYGAFLLL